MEAKNFNTVSKKIDILNITECRMDPFQAADPTNFTFGPVKFETRKVRKNVKQSKNINNGI